METYKTDLWLIRMEHIVVYGQHLSIIITLEPLTLSETTWCVHVHMKSIH